MYNLFWLVHACNMLGLCYYIGGVMGYVIAILIVGGITGVIYFIFQLMKNAK
jgi:hypothetical protein